MSRSAGGYMYDNGYGGRTWIEGEPPAGVRAGLIGPPLTPGSPEAMSYMTEESLVGLRRSGTLIMLLTGVAAAIAIAGFVSIFFFELTTSEWFGNFYTWLVFLPLLLLMLLWPTLMFAKSCNLISTSYTVFTGLFTIFGLLMLALMIWVLVEWFWYCPTFKPDICTDGSSSTIEVGFMIYAIVIILETVMLFVFLFVLWGMRSHYRKLSSGLSTMDRAKAAGYIYDAMFLGTTSYVKAIGNVQIAMQNV